MSCIDMCKTNLHTNYKLKTKTRRKKMFHGLSTTKNVQYTHVEIVCVCVYVCIEAIKKTPFFKYHYKRWIVLLCTYVSVYVQTHSVLG